MVDPVSATVVGGGLAVLASKDLLNKLLGPSADYIGGEAKNFVEKQHHNVNRIFRSALTKLGDKADQPGTVAPRVLKNVLDEARFCEDELAAEYFGGILASSRTKEGRDDRGVAIAQVVKGLSVYQIRTHYIFYRIVKSLFDGSGLNLQVPSEARQASVLLPHSVWVDAMGFSKHEDDHLVANHVALSLKRLDLIAHAAWGSEDFLKSEGLREVDSDGVVFAPTGFGAELFQWAHGRGDLSPAQLLDESVTLPDQAGIVIPDGARPSREK